MDPGILKGGGYVMGEKMCRAEWSEAWNCFRLIIFLVFYSTWIKKYGICFVFIK